MKFDNMAKKFLPLILGGSMVLGLLTGCNSWEKDFEKAKTQASASGKGIFLLFSGDEWNAESVLFRNNVLDKNAFRKELKKDYIFVNIDISNEEYNAAEKNDLLDLYRVNQIPEVYLLTSGGCVLDVIPYDETLTTPEAMLARLAQKDEYVQNLNNIFKLLKESGDKEKVLYIDEIYEATPENYRLVLEDLLRQIPVLDPYNETKLLGKYELQLAYFNAIQRARENDVEGLQAIFTDICENGHLSGEEKQQAYYTAAFVLASLNSEDYELITKYLQNAFDCAPESENAQTIREAIISVKQMAFTVKIMAMEQSSESQVEGEGDLMPEPESENEEENAQEQPAQEPVLNQPEQEN